MKYVSQSNGERGSALLIVFVFAAMIAIMLYSEMPVAVFEAKRIKEQLLIDRGNEYAHGVKLYVRKVGQYPPSLDALENTNRMRFLRRRYKDPFTGKDEWRLLHAGPNGMLIDSKVNPVGNNMGAGNTASGTGTNSANNNTSANSSFGGFGANSASNNNTSGNSTFAGFNNSIASSTDSATDTVTTNTPQRPPAIAANGSGTPVQGANGLPPEAPFPPPFPGTQSANGTQANTSANAATVTPINPNTANGTDLNNPQMAANGQPVNGNSAVPPNGAGSNQVPQQTFGNQAAQQGFGGTNAGGSNPGGIRAGLSNSSSSTFGNPQSSSSSSSGMRGIQSGGIAGVASKVSGNSIKMVNDQENYSLWEFYYDPTKDAARNMAGAMSQIGGNRGTGQQNSTTGTGSNSGFGNSGQSSSGFGNSFGGSGSRNNSFGRGGSTGNNSSFGNSGFGSSGGFGSSQPTAPANTTPNPPQQ